MRIARAERLGVGKICFGNHQHRLRALVHGNGRKLIQHQCAGCGLHRAGHKKHLIDIGHRWAHKYVFARQNLGDDGRAALGLDADGVSRHGRDAPFAKDAARTAFQNGAARFDIVKPADALDDIMIEHPHSSIAAASGFRGSREAFLLNWLI